MDPAYSRHSRRSHPNLHHLSLLPLTPHYPLPPTPLSSTQPHPSYLAPKSLPTTPSILSRSSSRTRLPTTRSNHALLSLSLSLNPTPPSNPPTSIPHPRPPHPRRTPSHTTTSSTSDWLSQTATLLTSTARAEKGQTWLATRSSSTSLAADAYGMSSLSLDTQSLYNGAEADDEYSPTSYRTPFNASRPQSGVASARDSRRGSRVGVRGLGGEEEEEEDEGGEVLGMGMEPDFVDGDGDGGEEGEGEVDEGEVRRLIAVRVGGWVDWLVGWMDFRADEEGEGGEEGGEDGEVRVEVGGEGIGRRKGRESEGVVVGERGVVEGMVEKPPEEGEGVWRDAAWLLSVATKIIT